MAAGLYWDWMVNKGRQDGCALGDDYIEVHFEDLLREPRQTLARLGQFIRQELDYDQIMKVGIGSVSAPRFFIGGVGSRDFNPVGRWHGGFTEPELMMFEGLVGRTLEENGYELATKNRDALRRADLQLMRAVYRTYFDTKLTRRRRRPWEVCW